MAAKMSTSEDMNIAPSNFWNAVKRTKVPLSQKRSINRFVGMSTPGIKSATVGTSTPA